MRHPYIGQKTTTGGTVIYVDQGHAHVLTGNHTQIMSLDILGLENPAALLATLAAPSPAQRIVGRLGETLTQIDALIGDPARTYGGEPITLGRLILMAAERVSR